MHVENISNVNNTAEHVMIKFTGVTSFLLNLKWQTVPAYFDVKMPSYYEKGLIISNVMDKWAKYTGADYHHTKIYLQIKYFYNSTI